MISYFFPPFLGSSGYLRTLKFAQYLPGLGFEPIILTANIKSYHKSDMDMIKMLPTNLIVRRSFALNIKKHFSLKGKYPNFFDIPDQYSTWIPDSIHEGLKIIREYKIELIFSTYPVTSAHLIGWILHRLTKIPWIADFRDPMWDKYTLVPKIQLKSRKKIELKTIQNASHITCTTASMEKLLLDRYNKLSRQNITTIPNGYDEDDFKDINMINNQEEKKRIIHAGLLERIDRDPFPFFEGVKIFIEKTKLDENLIKIDFFNPGDDKMYNEKIKKLNLENIINIREHIPYKNILKEMNQSDLLLLFQGKTCDIQVPAKFYEYLRIGKPIMALTTKNGETGNLVKKTKSGFVVDIENKIEIADTLESWYNHVKNGDPMPKPDKETVKNFTRESHTIQLAKCFDKVLKN